MHACKDYLHDVTINYDGEDELWKVVSDEINLGVESLSSASDTLYRQMKQHLESKLKGKTTQHGHNREHVPVLKDEATLFGK